MGDMFRSERMALCQMFIQPEAAYTSVAALGEKGCVQFRDLNTEINAYQRKFVTEVRRCDELERKLRYIENELRKDKIHWEEIDVEDEPHAPNPRETINLEAQLESIETEIKELSQNNSNLSTNYHSLIELKQVLENTEGFFSDQEVMNLDTNRFTPADEPMQAHREQLAFVAGVIKLERFFSFERMLWRMSRGNIFVRRSDLEGMTPDPETGHPTLKTVFVAFFQGEQLKQRVKKVCAGFHASVYPCPSAHAERMEMIRDVNLRLEDLKMVLNQTADHRSRMLVSAAKYLPSWIIMVKKMKAVYHTLNLFNMDVSNKCLIGEGWVPKRDIAIVQKALADGSAMVESTIPSFLNVIETDEQPPTYTRTNKFTKGFQNLIDSYGVASYREVNPALYTCITFPFLFAVMFGDAGHGLILFLVGLWMCTCEKKLSKIKGEIWNIFFTGRYIILLMGTFSIYTGFIYNDIFSKSMNIFGSRWHVMYNTSTVLENAHLQLSPNYAVTGTYPLGMDPIWQLASNKIIFLNTYKMKLSIIFGVLHMIFGICMSLINFNYFKKRMSIILEFIPQMVFMVLLFGYMVFMMFYKWVTYSAKTNELVLTPGCAPSILILFINMMLFNHSPPQEGCKEYMFEAQEQMQTIFVFVALICIPWLLLARPFYEMCRRSYNKKHVKPEIINGNGTIIEESSSMTDIPIKAVPSKKEHEHEEEPMGEIFIHQAIHTIEYILSTVSHTASYLRLWALSLAHAQLSEVLWNMVLHFGFVFPGAIGIIMLFIVFSGWAGLTIGILVLIEGLSAFLHTLRLHWVEFMSKFYEGVGYAFQPFSFRAIIDGTDGDA